MIGVRIAGAKTGDYVSYNGDKIVYGDHGELILEEVATGGQGSEPASRIMAIFAPGYWISVKQLA